VGAQRAVVIGAGSIGMRHLRVLEEMGLSCALVSRRAADLHGLTVPVFADAERAVWEWEPSYIVVANETTRHRSALEQLVRADFAGWVLVEKPLSDQPFDSIEHGFADLRVGYQLRFHPAVMAARERLGNSRILAVDAYVGQHLADWRPGRAIGATASASASTGGGVLRDLSHELDLVLLLAGGWRRVAATGGSSGTLGPDVDSDDRWAIVLELEGGAIATIHLNALDHVGQRRLTIVADDTTCALDLVAGTLEEAGQAAGLCIEGGVDRDEVITGMHRAVLTGDEAACSSEAALEVVRLIAAIERSFTERCWVERSR